MTRKGKFLTGATAVVMLTAAAGVAVAGGERHGQGPHGGHGAMMMLERFDTDGDGKATRAEVEAWRADQLKRFDTDGDGTLSLAEFQPLFAEMMKPASVRAFQQLDRDGDGKITEAEQTRPIERMFSRMDRNDDDTVEPGEMGGRHGMHRGRE